MSTPTKYTIELRDKSFVLKKRLEAWATRVSWEWNAFGGCGRAQLTVEGDYKRFDVEADDDIRIYLPNTGLAAADLRYRGYVEHVAPSITGGKQSINIECQGYFAWLDRLIVHDTGEEKVYYGQEVSAIVDDIIDSFVVSKTSITRGTTEASSVSPDVISFKGKVRDVIRTLVDLVGNVECGVDANLQFYWYNRTKTFKDRFFVGSNVTKIDDRVDFKNIINKIYFEGGDVNGTAFQTTGESSRSQAKYGVFEIILQNGSITTKATADQYIKAYLAEKAIPQRQLCVSVKNINKILESRFPMGAVAIVDKDVYQHALIYGTTANGGSNVLFGKAQAGGSNKKYGTTPRNQIDRISYSFTPEAGRLNADIQFGNSLSASRASAAMKQLEDNLNAVRQRSL